MSFYKNKHIIMIAFILSLSCVAKGGFAQSTLTTYQSYISILNFINSQEYDKALKEIDGLLKQDPRDKRAHFLKGKVYAHTEPLAKLTGYYLHPPKKPPRPHVVVAHQRLARQQAYMIKKAIDEFSQALQIDAEYIDAYNYRIVMYYLAEEYNKGLEDAKILNRLGSPANPQFLGALTGAALREGVVTMEELFSKDRD